MNILKRIVIVLLSALVSVCSGIFIGLFSFELIAKNSKGVGMASAYADAFLAFGIGLLLAISVFSVLLFVCFKRYPGIAQSKS